MVRWHIFFHGRVQGVGFRATSKAAAARHAVSGWVKNRSDGSVEMVVEGERTIVRRFVESVCESTHGHVADQEMIKSQATGEFKGFSIRH